MFHFFTSSHSRRRAFTLVELLVCIGIMALLAAILFPVFATSRERGRRAVCASNLRQIGLAWTQYAQDYDERTLTYRYRTVVPRYDYGLLTALDPYTKTRQIYVCPSETPLRPDVLTTAEDDLELVNGNNPSYGYNTGPVILDYGIGWNPGGLVGKLEVQPISLSMIGCLLAAIRSPAQMFVAGDSASDSWVDLQPRKGVDGTPTTQSQQRHGGWKNMLFADGHVKAVLFRVGQGDSVLGNTLLALPSDTSYYASYCLDAAAVFQSPAPFGTKTCGEAMPWMQSHVAQWLPG